MKKRLYYKRNRTKLVLISLVILILIILTIFTLKNFLIIKLIRLFFSQSKVSAAPSLPLQPLMDRKVYAHGMYLDWDSILPTATLSQIPLEITYKNLNTGENFTRQYTLFDDGQHDDNLVGDKAFGNNLLIENILPPGEYRLNIAEGCIGCGVLRIGSGPKIKIVPVITGQCAELIPGKNDLNDPARLNIIILGRHLSPSQYSESANHALEFDETNLRGNVMGFFNLPPMENYRDKFNVWHIVPHYTGTQSAGTASTGNFFFLEYMTSRCPFQNSFYVIYDRDCCRAQYGLKAIFYPEENYIRVDNALIRDKTMGTLSHELGHHFSSQTNEQQILTDEYICATLGHDIPSGFSNGHNPFPNLYKAPASSNTQRTCQINAEWSHLNGSCYYRDDINGDGIGDISAGNLNYESCQSQNIIMLSSGGISPPAEEVRCESSITQGICPDGSAIYNWRPAFRTLMKDTDFLPSTIDISYFCRELERYTGESRGICNSLCINGCPAGHSCRDSNNDGIGECISQACPQGDNDGDTICNNIDNCPNNANLNQDDLDNDGIGDACDLDKDGDSFTIPSDCSDIDSQINPNAIEFCGNGIDENCNPSDDICPANCIDNDGDGYGTDCPLGPESCDNDPTINPGQEEICDNIDNNCDGITDQITRSCGIARGICTPGTEQCSNGVWGICQGEIAQQVTSESCPDGTNNCPICQDSLDNDCDGVVNSCACEFTNARWELPNTTIINKTNSQTTLLLKHDIDTSQGCFQFQQYEVDVRIKHLNTTLEDTEAITIPWFGSYNYWLAEYEIYCDSNTLSCTSMQYYFNIKKRFHPENESLKSPDLTVLSECDQDGDLYIAQSCSQSIPSQYINTDFDCNDINDSIYPNAKESCDGIDNQCPGNTGYGNVDEGCFPTAPKIVYVTQMSQVNLIEGGIKNTNFNFTVEDDNGADDINDSTIIAKFSKPGEQVRLSNSCIIINSSAITKTFQCTIGMEFYDASGLWNITISINDSAGVTAINNTNSFLVNPLMSISLNPKSVLFPISSPTSTDILANAPITIRNDGNYANVITITAHDLYGIITDEIIPASNFKASGNLGVCTLGNSLSNSTEVAIAGTYLNRGASQTAEIYYCLTNVPALSSQQYKTLANFGWQVSLL